MVRNTGYALGWPSPEAIVQLVIPGTPYLILNPNVA